ncbi:MAG: hypothetical protein GOV01_02340 [Candidatus Altiarchaeota archaeon]|nr:hypothetical protein [Candidatus Altiarchaeota archaeon]
MNVYETDRLKILKLGVTHPAIRKLDEQETKCWSSVQTGVLKLRGKKVVVCPVQYRYSKIAEQQKKYFPLMSVIGISEYDNHLLVGLRSGSVRFPNTMGAAPTGHVEFGLRPDEAMEMELKEELGVGGKQKLIGIQLSPMYLGLIYKIDLFSNEVNPSWEWSNLMWIQKDKIGEFLQKNGGQFGPGFGASFLLYLHKEGYNIDKIVNANKWDVSIKDINELAWRFGQNR